MNFKRNVLLVHRWTGVLMCVLMALWFASGMVMLFVGYPKLTPWERLGSLPALAQAGCCVSPERALAHSRAPGEIKGLVLTSVRNHPVYVVTEADGKPLVVDAVTGAAGPPVDAAAALAGARAFFPGAAARYAGQVIEDRWTHSRSLERHRPLHVVEMGDAAATRLYLSSSTGQVVLDAPRGQQLWNYVGAWLHWLYMFRNQPVDPVWSWTVIALSALGVVSSLTGVLNGIWRWRFAGSYKNGAKTPFREGVMRWHHLLGLVFGTILFAWILSGLMSMNPVGVFDAKGQRPDLAAFEGGQPGTTRLSIDAAQAVSLLKAQGFTASELEWRVLGGQPAILARDAGNHTRLVTAWENGFVVRARWTDAALLAAAQRLLPAPIVQQQVLDRYDTYYYKRALQSMYGADERRLPALRLVYGDGGATWVHLDPYTGAVASSLDRSQRTGRWLFNFLHSWDLPAMLDAGWLRDAVLILLGVGGLALCATATVLGARRLRSWWKAQRAAEAEAGAAAGMLRR
ncbi:PepSY domain-containing protein [Massilia sp. CFBP 13721]|uniref:PepSY domain-containing protein n=1 Tax=Massilia sp. CFBP 13721 TaxID=2775300 RepID=UPI00177C355B|nr:PepSY domain-containing protein [Massilia sp. CFBP 13721]